jgi:hypothetical protein
MAIVCARIVAHSQARIQHMISFGTTVCAAAFGAVQKKLSRRFALHG